MQGYSFTEDLTHRPDTPSTLAACLRDGTGTDLARYRELTAAAEEHAVGPLLREQVLAHRSGDAPGYTALHDEALRDAALDARRNVQVARCITALARAGVPSLVFKGTALAHSHYPRPDLRPRDDTDLLLRPEHLDTAHTVLTREGFHLLPGVEGSLIMRQRLYRQVDADGLLHNLDVHWAVTNEPRAQVFAPATLLATGRPLNALSPHARAPGDTEALLLACLHLDAHHAGQVRLIWLYDVDLLVRGMPLAARQHACAAAMARELQAPCAWVLAATRTAFDTPLDGFGPLLTSTPASAPSAGRARAWLRDLSRLPGTVHRLRWILQHLFPPADYLRHRFSSRAPAWQLYARRALRGVGHLLQR